MNTKQLAKLLVQKHFEIRALLIDEALQCAAITASFMNNEELIEEINLLKLKEYETSKGTPLEKYWINKRTEIVTKQMELF